MNDKTDRPGRCCPTRRSFSAGSLALIAVASLAARPGRAAEYPGAEPRCATCDFWGGVRQLSPGGKAVVVEDDITGQCNNPKSPLYQKKTKPTQLFKAGYVRWKQLG